MEPIRVPRLVRQVSSTPSNQIKQTTAKEYFVCLVQLWVQQIKLLNSKSWDQSLAKKIPSCCKKLLKIGLKHSHRYNFWNGISSSQHWLKVWNLLVTVDIWQSGWCSWKTLTMLTSFILSFFEYVVNVQILHVMLTCPLQGNSGRQWAWNIRYGGFLHCCIYLDSCALKTAWTAESMIDLTQMINCKSSYKK